MAKEHQQFCGAMNGKGLPCEKVQGFGTNHLGYGRCKFHGGAVEDLSQFKAREYLAEIQTTQGLLNEIKSDQIHAIAQRLNSTSRNFFDFREHVAIIESLAMIALDQGQTDQAAKLLRTAISAMSKLHEIEVGRRVLISVRDVSEILEQVAVIVHRHVTDDHTKRMIARDIARLSIGDFNQPIEATATLLPTHGTPS